MVFEDRKGNTTNEYQTKKGTQRKKFVSPPFSCSPWTAFHRCLERRLAIICKTRDKKTKIEAEGLKT
jgi:hypothetical protein